jgi:predicted kinase
MDLEHLGRPDLAHRFLRRYREVSGDVWPTSLEHLYIAYRALVRAKVACLRGHEATIDARLHLALAKRHLEAGRIRLVLIGGAPGTGKTTLANALARRLDLPVLHSDEVRKQLAGLAPTSHHPAAVDAGIYSPAWDDRTYAALGERAADHVRRGRSVVIDASWSEDRRRAEMAALAGATSSELVAFRCSVAPGVAAARASARAESGLDASDVAGDMARTLGARFADWPEAAVVDTAADPGTIVAAVIAAMDATAPAP